MDYNTLVASINRKKGEYEAIKNEKLKKEAELAALERKLEVFDKARVFLLELSKKQRNSIKQLFEESISNALQYIIHDEDLYFEIEITESRGSAEVNFYLKMVRDGKIVRIDLDDSQGDGYIDVISLAINTVMYLKGRNNCPLILDEPAKQLSEGYREAAGMYLQEISELFDFQIIMITNVEQLSNFGHAKYKVTRNGNSSKIKKIV